jgi:hypothetical protein
MGFANWRRAAALFLVLLPAGPSGAAEPTAPASAGTTRTVVVGERFRKSGVYQLLFGHNYRELWTTPVDLPLLDLATFAGGLTPTRVVGHGQTQGLAFAGADGQAYTFRPLLKDPVGLLPEELRATLAGVFVRDQMSSGHPAGHVMVPPLMQALGLPHNTPRIVIMPDDPALGEFRAQFRNVPGNIEEYTGQRGYAGSERMLDGAGLWAALDASPEVRIDARVFLTVRLLDHLIGDWDRHREQWRWLKLPGRERWLPIPEDRDQAFVRFQGAVIRQVRAGLPLLINFGEKYPDIEGLLFDSWDVDRRLLNELPWPVWAEVAAEVRAKLNDEVLQASVDAMPAAYRAKLGAELLHALKRRREGLERHARHYYEFLARQVDVRATDQADSVDVLRHPNGDVEVSVALRAAEGQAPGTPYYRRLFRKDETREVRLLLLAGNDEVRTRGPRNDLGVRVVGGPGNDQVDDRASGGLRVSDAMGANEVLAGPGTSWDRKPYTEPPPSPRGAWIPPRDWGRRTIFPMVRLTGATDIGLLVDVGLRSTGYGFRRYPFADQQIARVGYSTAHNAFRGEYRGEFRPENSKLRYTLQARASAFDIVRFYGFGNETRADSPDAFYKVETDQLLLAPALVVPLGTRASVSLGPLLGYATTEKEDQVLLGTLKPYGSGGFGQLGAQATVDIDTRDVQGLARRGVQLRFGGTYYPAVWSVASAFGSLHGEGTTYLHAQLPLQPTLVLRAGGKRVWGRYPYQESAFLGGANTLRGLRTQRYAGDAALYGSAELRLSLASAFVFVPGEIGVLGLVDVGRVYLEGEDSQRWHRGVGGGLFFSSPQRRNLVSIALARSEGRLGFYLKAGLGF